MHEWKSTARGRRGCNSSQVPPPPSRLEAHKRRASSMACFTESERGESENKQGLLGASAAQVVWQNANFTGVQQKKRKKERESG